MTLIFGILSYFIVSFLIFPYLDSFAYTTKNILVHGFFGLILVFIHSQLGFIGLFNNILYLWVVGYSLLLAKKDMVKQNPDMNDTLGHIVVKRANILFLVTYFLGYIFLNIKYLNIN